MLKLEELVSNLNYNPKSGKFFWKTPPRKGVGIEREAGYTNYLGYRQIRYKKELYHCHKLAYFIEYGEYPELIDHINRDPSDNRIDNLRKATHQQNMVNSKTRVDNKTGVKGVFKLDHRYLAYINRFGKRHRLGLFNTLEEATAARQEAQRILDNE